MSAVINIVFYITAVKTRKLTVITFDVGTVGYKQVVFSESYFFTRTNRNFKIFCFGNNAVSVAEGIFNSVTIKLFFVIDNKFTVRLQVEIAAVCVNIPAV